ncbi:MAG TPA: cytochrome c [Gemmatimonadales bacterium]|nr:cytochrome c [Gemmatimonadota bacterium]MCB9505465.1 cytochrome c [Gemmatimonadales bacterium]MCB9518649.1 cytochrome c [Gemmatimonadales bacterium]HPF62136.1 cytochrome c [Gemmatimonadales bacterium]HRX18246.1 cytochrome c [Gemmatimonadales bacterium]
MLTTKIARLAPNALLAVLAGGLIACGGGDAAPAEDAPPAAEPAPMAQTAGIDGATEYTTTCSACHQANGEGMPGAFPPLAGSDIANNPSPDRMIAIVLKGLQGPVTVKGMEYNGMMAPWESLSDEQIAAITTYERSSWGNSAPAVTTEMVAAVRAKVADRTTSWTMAELEAAIP